MEILNTICILTQFTAETLSTYFQQKKAKSNIHRKKNKYRLISLIYFRFIQSIVLLDFIIAGFAGDNATYYIVVIPYNEVSLGVKMLPSL